MSDRPGLITAADLDQLSPDERAAAFRARIVVSLEDLPEGFRDRVLRTSKQIQSELDLLAAGG
jgi:hypothetical protein